MLITMGQSMMTSDQVGFWDTDDSLERATGTDRSLRSISSIADRNITKVSSTRKLNDQGGEGFLLPSSALKDAVIAKDKIKEQRMNDLGITVLRFRDEEVYHHMQSVLLEIERFMDNFEVRNK